MRIKTIPDYSLTSQPSDVYIGAAARNVNYVQCYSYLFSQFLLDY